MSQVLPRWHPSAGHHCHRGGAPCPGVAGACVSPAVPHRSASAVTRFLSTNQRGRDLPFPVPFCTCFGEVENKMPSFGCMRVSALQRAAPQQWKRVMEKGRMGLSPSEMSLRTHRSQGRVTAYLGAYGHCVLSSGSAEDQEARNLRPNPICPHADPYYPAESHRTPTALAHSCHQVTINFGLNSACDAAYPALYDLQAYQQSAGQA